MAYTRREFIRSAGVSVLALAGCSSAPVTKKSTGRVVVIGADPDGRATATGPEGVGVGRAVCPPPEVQPASSISSGTASSGPRGGRRGT